MSSDSPQRPPRYLRRLHPEEHLAQPLHLPHRPRLHHLLLTQKWERERSYHLRKELFAFTDDRIAVQFWYEYRDAREGMKRKRCYGLEDWTFDADGRMRKRKRMVSGNHVEIAEGEILFGEGVEDVDSVETEERD
ncbi:hypothetical protein MMC08_002272, partial [Hypocenomyce scalaris]|nr:hypothetical protein [Hypocenomyce scalaris]